MTSDILSSNVLETIMDGSTNAVRSIVRKKYAHIFTESDIEEAIGDTRLHAWRSISSFDPSKGDAFSWVYSISRNCVLDTLNDITKRKPLDGDMEYTNKKGEVVNVSDELGYSDSSYDADYVTSYNDFEDKLNAVASSTLNEDELEHYKLIAQEYKPREIAAELGCTPAAASVRKFRIREKLEPHAIALAKEHDIDLKK